MEIEINERSVCLPCKISNKFERVVDHNDCSLGFWNVVIGPDDYNKKVEENYLKNTKVAVPDSSYLR